MPSKMELYPILLWFGAFLKTCDLAMGFTSSFMARKNNPIPLCNNNCPTLHLTTTRSTWLSATTDSDSSTTAATEKMDATDDMTTEDCLAILDRAAATRAEDSDTVLQALTRLEKLQRQNKNAAADILSYLPGSWQLVFTTGTANTQQKYGKINYFPLKAVQCFNTEGAGTISNGIFVGDFALVQFRGTFQFDPRKRRLEFGFDVLTLLQLLEFQLGKGDAEQLGAASGLGSASNVERVQKEQKKAFFNWISADETIATARGGGGGLALWKRIDRQYAKEDDE